MKQYRQDIDALRAVAVLLVIFYHTGAGVFKGGFVGVDVFFVISGFLITGILQRNIINGTFTFSGFYENRIRRILPALIVVSLTVMVLGSYIYFAVNDFKILQRTIKRSILAVSNFYFYFNNGYFDVPSISQPMLHTWSLGIEEQFYLIFPTVIWLCHKYFKSKLMVILCSICAVSFLSSTVYVYINPDFTFYMLPTRAWELLLGGLLAIKGWSPARQYMKKICAYLGLCFIVVAAAVYNRLIFVPFPGLAALPPCLGAFLFIAGCTDLDAGSRSFKIFTDRRLVFVGLLSYSLYLWHWPVFVLYKEFFVVYSFSATELIALLAVIFMLSCLSWKFVETPLRRKEIFFRKRVLYPTALAGMISVLLLSSFVRTPFVPEEGRSFLAGMEDKAESYPENILGNKTDPVSFVLLGDSHAFSQAFCLDFLAREHGLSGVLITNPYFLKNAYRHIFSDEKNLEAQRDNFTLIKNTGAKTVFIIARFPCDLYGLDSRNVNTAESLIRYITSEKKAISGITGLYYALSDTIRELVDIGVKDIYIALPTPEMYFEIPQAAAGLVKHMDKSESEFNKKLGLRKAQYMARSGEIIAMLEKMAQEHNGVHIVDPLAPLWDEKIQVFKALENDRAIYSDDDHLSRFGSMLLRPVYEPLFARMKSGV